MKSPLRRSSIRKQPQPALDDNPIASLRGSPSIKFRLLQTRSPSSTTPCAVLQHPRHLAGSHSRPASKHGHRAVWQFIAQAHPVWRLVQAGPQRHQRSQKCVLLAQGQEDEQMAPGGHAQGLYCGHAFESLCLRRASNAAAGFFGACCLHHIAACMAEISRGG
jgi:hypothetical protein